MSSALPHGARQAYVADGFIHLRNILQEEDLNTLSSLLKKIHPTEPGSSSGDQVTTELKRLVNIEPQLQALGLFESLREIASELIDQTCHYSFDHAIFVPPGQEAINWHQDRVYKLSLKEMNSLHFWIPLDDVDMNCSPLEYVPGSHEDGLLDHHQSTNSDYVHIPDREYERTTVCPCQKGDVLVHHPLTVHRSLRNSSDKERRAWILHFSPHGRMDRFLPSNLLFHLKQRLQRHKTLATR